MSDPEIRLQPVEGWRHYNLVVRRESHWRVPDYISTSWFSLSLLLETSIEYIRTYHPFLVDLLADLQAGNLRGKCYLQGNAGVLWKGPRLTARCCREALLTPARHQHAACPPAGPHLREGRCHCGIYLVPEIDLSSWIIKYRHHFLKLYARCKGWGYVVEHELGWRCEVVEIEALYLFMRGTVLADSRTQLIDALAARYPVPIKIITFPREPECVMQRA